MRMGKLFTLKDEAEKRSKRIVIRVTTDEELKEPLVCGRWTFLSSRVAQRWVARRMWTIKLKQCLR
jgi:hypothetical protein